MGFNEYTNEIMWRTGRVRAAPIISLCEEWCRGNSLTFRDLSLMAGLSDGFLAKAMTRKSIEFRCADKLLVVMGMTECWHSPELADDYLNVNLTDAPRKKSNPIVAHCAFKACNVRVEKYGEFCGEGCRKLQNQHRYQLKKKRKALAGGS